MLVQPLNVSPAYVLSGFLISHPPDPEVDGHQDELTELDQQVDRLKSLSLEDSTKRSYASYRKKYLTSNSLHVTLYYTKFNPLPLA